ncbi:MAG: FimB/Mfa2 family fimbrial subunit [Clostridiales bacterium]|nr:FimB/Mfa2 family fimbrial subunit [Clostridiales bacterium]
MKLITYITSRLAALALATVALSSCQGMIYDDEGDCDPYYKVKFRFDRNMAFADAFPNEVNSVTLYAFDAATGDLVWSNHESGERLAQEGYVMDLPVDPGKYHLMAWCGDGHKTSFKVNDASHIDALHCRMEREYKSRAGEVAVSSKDLDRLYHGRIEDQVMPDEQGVHYYTVPLTKDTNVIRVMLQQLSGEKMLYSDFDFEITDANGHLESDNTLRGSETIYYTPWSQKNAIGNIVYPDAEHTTDLGAVLAEFTTSRLTTGSSPRLTVKKHNGGDVIFSVPLKPYLLAFKGDHHASMNDQEYLDREDEYNMVFFLDEGMRWMNSYIYINSFKVVLQDVDL